MDVSKNRVGPPKSSILIGFSLINHPFEVPLFLETPIWSSVGSVCHLVLCRSWVLNSSSKYRLCSCSLSVHFLIFMNQIWWCDDMMIAICVSLAYLNGFNPKLVFFCSPLLQQDAPLEEWFLKSATSNDLKKNGVVYSLMFNNLMLKCISLPHTFAKNLKMVSSSGQWYHPKSRQCLFFQTEAPSSQAPPPGPEEGQFTVLKTQGFRVPRCGLVGFDMVFC